MCFGGVKLPIEPYFTGLAPGRGEFFPSTYFLRDRIFDFESNISPRTKNRMSLYLPGTELLGPVYLMGDSFGSLASSVTYLVFLSPIIFDTFVRVSPFVIYIL